MRKSSNGIYVLLIYFPDGTSKRNIIKLLGYLLLTDFMTIIIIKKGL